MEHPLEKCRISQKKFLENCPPEERDWHAQFFRIGNATYCYHQMAADAEPTIEYFKEWLGGLPENIRKDMEKKGFEECKSVLPFTRYVNERDDIGLDQFLKENLIIQDYEAHQKMGDSLNENG